MVLALAESGYGIVVEDVDLFAGIGDAEVVDRSEVLDPRSSKYYIGFVVQVDVVIKWF
jgi:hypothetical protein